MCVSGPDQLMSLIFSHECELVSLLLGAIFGGLSGSVLEEKTEDSHGSDE